MAITFLCPNGHKLSCPDDRAGRGARCPECGVAFRVPEPVTPSAAETPENEDGPEVSVPPGQIMFLCPNGHRLFGPPSLIGRPGKCPHCDIKFLIPWPDEEPGDAEAPQPAAMADSSKLRIPADRLAAGGARESSAGRSPAPLHLEWIKGQSGQSPSPPSGAESQVAGSGPHPLFDLFGRLWKHADEGAAVELHLSNGEVITPLRYSANLSRQQHGVFAVRDPSGAYEVTAIAWDAVIRVAVIGMEQLPPGAFD
jgi:hypothetical protein